LRKKAVVRLVPVGLFRSADHLFDPLIIYSRILLRRARPERARAVMS
jgi:hypothetical protein